MTRAEQMAALALALAPADGGPVMFRASDEAQAKRIYDEAKRLAVLMAMRRWEPVCRDLTG